MKKFNLLFIFMFISFFACFIPVKASNAYTVQMVSNSSSNKVIGSYSTYSEAVSVMNKQSSSSTSVASVYKNGKIINSRYAIFRFNPSSKTLNLYQNASDTAAYTYTNPSSMTDTAFINSNESRVNIMLNGFNGWADINSGTIIPISLLSSNMVKITASGLNLRQSTSTSSASLASITCTNALFTYTEKKSDGKYTWYKINYNGKTGYVASGSWLTETTGNDLDTYYYRYSTGNLLHRFAYHNGSIYTDSFTNLGPTPSYLTEGVHYYSFDGGIYLYSSLTSMLDDYRSGSYSRSINASNPNYAYYLFLPSKSVSKITASELNSQITNKSSKLYGTGEYFKEAEKLYGMNALSAFATAKNESSSGTSKIALNKNNVFGYGASDSCPDTCAYSYSSVKDSIMDYAKNGLSSYMTAEAVYYFGTNSGTKGSGRNVKYASDPLWGEKQAANAFITDKSSNLRDYKANTIGVTKYGKYNVPVYKDSNGSSVIYYLRNKNSNLKVYNVAVTVLGREGNYYKVYADSKSYSYGYIKVSDLNLTNNEPVINVSDKEIKLNSTFNALDGVKASDSEDGNLTSKITCDSKVDTSKAGTYKVTYNVTDNSNFTTTKTINVTVKGDSVPVITASDKEVSASTSFNYLDGVKASDDLDGDLTSKITYSGEVDTSKEGEYKVTYSVTNSLGKTTTKTITVKVIPNEKPVIDAKDKTAYLNREFNYLDGVKASDKEDGDLTGKITYSGEVDTSKEGKYEVTYSVVDSANQKVSKTITVTVEEKQLEEKDGEFYLDYLKEIDGKLQIKGYNTIQGIDNNLNTDIDYYIILKNQNTKKEVIQKLSRVTNKKDMTLSPSSNDGHDYSYSWFVGDIDISEVSQGDYTLYLKSVSKDYYSNSVVQNIFLNEQTVQFNYDDKYVTITNDYTSEDIPVNFTIRNREIGKKETSADINQYSYLEKIEFKDGMAYLRGASYSVNLNMSSNAKLSRKIVFENVDTFEKYIYDLDYTTKGTFDINLIVNDNFGRLKELAWYDKNIDISKLPVGNYAIYITNKSNMSDYGELNDILLYSDLSNATTKINGKTYKFNLNTDLRYRIELKITE